MLRNKHIPVKDPGQVVAIIVYAISYAGHHKADKNGMQHNQFPQHQPFSQFIQDGKNRNDEQEYRQFHIPVRYQGKQEADEQGKNKKIISD
jgi:hypothetical protein